MPEKLVNGGESLFLSFQWMLDWL